MTRLLALLLLLLAASLDAQQPPDIVLIVTDDQPFHMQKFMPRTKALIGDRGVRFQRAFASSPLCCPSRAGILSGQHTHNHGVLDNDAPDGGAELFDDASTLATWLRQAGYRTALVGKYLNEYSLLEPFPYIPPGWNVWNAFVREKYTDYDLVEKGVVVHYGSSAAEYSTTVLADKAVQFINQTARTRPLFLYLAPFAPHFPAKPAPAHAGSASGVPPYRPANYNEPDVSDKPTWVQALPRLTPAQIDSVDNRIYRRMIESLQEVDRSVERVVNALQSKGRLANAVIVFTSDNGYSLGAHRWIRKSCPYEECIRTPLLVRAPGVSPRTEQALVSNIDLAPTFAELAGVTPPAGVNGMSLLPLLRNPRTPWRDAVLLEFLGSPEGVTPAPTNFQAVRTARYLYAEYTNSERELYDLAVDPQQLSNVAGDPAYASTVASMKVKLETLRSQ